MPRNSETIPFTPKEIIIEKKPTFSLDLAVQHWSCCWGGRVNFSKQHTETPQEIIEHFNKKNPWIGEFLKNNKPDQPIAISTVNESPNGWHRNLIGDFFIDLTCIQDQSTLHSNLSTFVSLDGIQVLPIKSEKRERVTIQDDLFTHKISQKPNSTLRFAYYQNKAGFIDNISFQENGGLIAAHLYLTDPNVIDFDLKTAVPIHTEIINYQNLHLPEY
ncbi:MAG: hypothetical protein PHP97_02215 [Candidatus Shapirobacteria bacterium]|nr:hypothetical protein [Candidatus Shapirobacteria bacterium]MDD3002585.1 hypothetical protein [Candidatus Shapirobacteria bacterium]MDD4382782.1 hypothetical protein [Candidatus Shapirobacteria bacterium]